MSKTALAGAEKYFRAVLEEMRDEWRVGTNAQRAVIVAKAAQVQLFLADVKVRQEKLRADDAEARMESVISG